MSERQDLANELCALAEEYGYMKGPTAEGVSLETGESGGKWYKFNISVPAILDGTVRVFKTDRIGIEYAQGSAYPRRTTLRNKIEFIEWMNGDR